MVLVGEEGRGWEGVMEVVLWVTVVHTVREDLWGAVEDGVMILWGDDNEGTGSLGGNAVISEVFEEEFVAKEGSTAAAGKVETDSEHIVGER